MSHFSFLTHPELAERALPLSILERGEVASDDLG